MMHDHNIDLIMSLAAGTVPADELAAAERQIASCPECEAELTLQRIALTAIIATPTPHLTEVESSRLHRAIREQLSDREPGVSRARRRLSGRSLGWGIGLAAGLAGLVLILPAAINGISRSSSDSLSEAAATTAAATVGAKELATNPAAANAAPEATIAGSDNRLKLEDHAAGVESTTTSAPARDDTLLPVIDIADLDIDAMRLRVIDEVAAGQEPGIILSPRNLESADVAQSCAATVGHDEFPDTIEVVALATIVGDPGGDMILVAYVQPDPKRTVLVLHRLSNCSIVDVSA